MNDKDKLKKRTGRDELNLIETAVFSLSTRPNKKILTRISWPADADKTEPHFEITATEKHGLPTATALDLYLVCMELSHTLGFSSRKIETTKYELIKLLGWPNQGHSYKRLTKAFNQLGGVWITTKNFYDKETESYIEQGFGIIDDYKFKNDIGYFRWNEVLFEKSLEFHNTRPIDPHIYHSLNSHITKALYRYTDLRLHNRPNHQIDLYELAYNKLGMVRYKYPSDVKKKMMPGITELMEKHIANIWIEKSKTLSGYKVCFQRAKKNQIAIEKNQANKAVKEFLEPTTQRGRIPHKSEIKLAEQIIDKYGLHKFREKARVILRNFHKSEYLKKVKSFNILRNYFK